MERYAPQTITERLGFMAYLFVVGGGTTDLGALVDEAMAEREEEFVYEPAPAPAARDASALPLQAEVQEREAELIAHP